MEELFNKPREFDFKFNLCSSYRYEKDKQPSTEIIDSLYKYLTEHEIPKLTEVYSIMFQSPLIRNEDVYVGRSCKYQSYSTIVKIDHIGLDASLIEIDKLQSMVDEIYTQEVSLTNLIKAFKYYIQYELIHPSLDGNGRIGRLIFIEWRFKLSFSSALLHLGLNQDVLFKPFQVPILYENEVPLNKDEALKNKDVKRYYIDDDKFDEKLIQKWIYQIIVYQHLYSMNHQYIGTIKKILKTKYEDLPQLKTKYDIGWLSKDCHNLFI
jgi:hypothetical protein